MVLSRNEKENVASHYAMQYKVEDWLVNLEEIVDDTDTIIFIYTEDCAKLKTGLLLVIKIIYSRNSKQEKTHFFKRSD